MRTVAHARRSGVFRLRTQTGTFRGRRRIISVVITNDCCRIPDTQTTAACVVFTDPRKRRGTNPAETNTKTVQRTARLVNGKN